MTASPRSAVLLACACASAITLVAPTGCKRAPESGPLTKGEKIEIARARAAYVTNNGSDSLSVLDRDGDRVQTVGVDVDPKAHEAPHHLAVDPSAGAVYVALAFPAPPGKTKDPHKAHGNADDPGKLAWLDLDTLATVATRDVDENPGDVVLTHDRTRLLVTHYDMKRAMDVAMAGGNAGAMAATLQVWDAKTRTKLAERAVCVAPHGIAVTADDRVAMIACYGSDELAVVDLASPGLPTARYPLGAQQGVPGAPHYGPYSATLSPDGARVIVASLEGADVRVFDRAKKAFLPERTMTLGARVMMPDFVDATTLVAPLQGPDGVARLDVETGAVGARVPFSPAVCQNPHAARRAKDGRVYVVCEGDHTAPGAIVEIDPRTLAVKRRWVVGVYPDGIAFGDD
jgi:DNA-binding beta-propeller fold protein YncE